MSVGRRRSPDFQEAAGSVHEPSAGHILSREKCQGRHGLKLCCGGGLASQRRREVIWGETEGEQGGDGEGIGRGVVLHLGVPRFGPTAALTADSNERGRSPEQIGVTVAPYGTWQ